MKRALVMGAVIMVFVLGLGVAVFAGVMQPERAAGTSSNAIAPEEKPDIDDEPDIEAVVLEIHEGGLEIYVLGERSTLATLHLPTGVELPPLQAGDVVRVWTTGIVAESFPPQYTAVALSHGGPASTAQREAASAAQAEWQSQIDDLLGGLDLDNQPPVEIFTLAPEEIQAVEGAGSVIYRYDVETGETTIEQVAPAQGRGGASVPAYYGASVTVEETGED